MFLKKGRCSVYKARPAQCRTCPFWAENMTPLKWENDVASYCPGIGKGRLYTSREIDDILKEQEEE